MDAHSADVELVTFSEILELATWNRPRTDDELREFINSHHDNLPDNIEIE